MEKKNNSKAVIISIVVIIVIACLVCGIIFLLNNKDNKDSSETPGTAVTEKKITEFNKEPKDLRNYITLKEYDIGVFDLYGNSIIDINTIYKRYGEEVRDKISNVIGAMVTYLNYLTDNEKLATEFYNFIADNLEGRTKEYSKSIEGIKLEAGKNSDGDWQVDFKIDE